MNAETSEDRLALLMFELRLPYRAEYAYPTSTIAISLGRSDTGCWFVSALVDGDINKPRKVISPRGWSTKEQAQLEADLFTQTARP
jgi:hypothetical protein